MIFNIYTIGVCAHALLLLLLSSSFLHVDFIFSKHWKAYQCPIKFYLCYIVLMLCTLLQVTTLCTVMLCYDNFHCNVTIIMLQFIH